MFLKTVSVDRSRLQIVGFTNGFQVFEPATYGTPTSDSGRTPMYGGDGKTPMYADRSPYSQFAFASFPFRLNIPRSLFSCSHWC